MRSGDETIVNGPGSVAGPQFVTRTGPLTTPLPPNERDVDVRPRPQVVSRDRRPPGLPVTGSRLAL